MPVLFLHANDLTVNSKDFSMSYTVVLTKQTSRTSPSWRVYVLLFDNCFLCLELISIKTMVVECSSMDVISDILTNTPHRSLSWPRVTKAD